MKTCQDSSLCR